MTDEYLTQTQIGKIYGVSSHVIGKWLKGLSLRNEQGQPTRKAVVEGYARQAPSTQPNTYFWVWHKQWTMNLFDRMNYPRAATTEPTSAGPTSAGQSLNTAQEGNVIA